VAERRRVGTEEASELGDEGIEERTELRR